MKILDKFNISFNKYPIGNLIDNNGADGEVFESNNNIIKFVNIYDSKTNVLKTFNKNRNVINKIIQEKPKHFVNVYDFGFVKEIDNFYNNYSIIYFYLMEKLNKLSEDEKKIFHTLISHEDFSKKKSLNKNRIDSIIDEFSNFYEFDKNKVYKFIEQIEKSKIKHLDIHDRNIMKDDLGNFKFIDLERLIIV